jgi:hypothetical protein
MSGFSRLGKLAGYLWPIVHPVTRYLAAWAVALGLACSITVSAWDRRQDDDRASGTDGHTTIDFGGQWAMGRMLVSGRGWTLFEREHLREMLVESYPLDDQTPKQKSGEELTDAESLMWSFMGEDDKSKPRNPGGPLYPPINAFVFAPLGLLTPLAAFRTHQVLSALLAVLSGLGVSVITRRRIWWPVAASVILIFPGYPSAQAIGQNSALTLLFAVWGWALFRLGRQGWGGVVWGLLAFKPVWALSFLLVLILTRRWRACLAMSAAGLAQIALTLPFVGVHSWIDWLEIGREAAALYDVDQNWVQLSRDVLSLPRALFLDFELERDKRDNLTVRLMSWALLIGVFELWTRVCLLRRDESQMVTGPAAGFVLLGASLCCYHYMYYDYLLVVLPALLILVRPRYPYGVRGPLETTTGWRIETIVEVGLRWLVVAAILLYEHVWPDLIGYNRKTPWHTVMALVLWLVCGWQWTRLASRSAREVDEELAEDIDESVTAKFGKFSADVGSPHERFANEDGFDARRP